MKKVIIIGSGIGGLVTGNLLAKRGHSVTIFEAHSMPGGYTAGFRRKGFYFESGTLSFEASASVFKAMKDIGVSDMLEFVRQRLRFVSREFEGIPDSYDDYKKMIYKGFPKDKEKLDAVFSEFDSMAVLAGNISKPMPYLNSGFGMFTSMLPYMFSGFKMMKLSKQYGDMTTSEFAERYFKKDSKLYRIFNSMGYPDTSAMFAGAGMASMFKDYWTVKGGMQSWADVLAENFRKFGGELKLNTHVDKIMTKNGAAIGVSCGDAVYDADYVISASDYKKTFLELLDNKNLVPGDTLDKIKKSAVSESIFTVYLGLGLSNEELSKYMKIPLVFVFSEEPGGDIYDPDDAGYFNKTCPSLYSPSMINSKHAPEGKSSLMLQVMVPYHWMNNWGGGDSKKYAELKEKAMNAMIENTAEMIPGLKDYIEYKDAATPLTYERFTRNTDGATSSWSWNPKKRFYKNAMGVNVDTPVRNLYIGSCWAMQVGGIPGALAAAYQCARKVK